MLSCFALGAEVSGHSQKELTQTLIVHLLKTHFLHRSLLAKNQQNRIELVTRPDGFSGWGVENIRLAPSMLGVLAGALAALALLGVAMSCLTPLKSGDFAGVLLALGVCMSRLIPLKPGEKFRKFNN